MKTLPYCLLPLALLLLDCKKTETLSSLPVELGPDTTSHNITWRVDTLGDYSDYLLDVWASSPTSVWAVGYLSAGPGVVGDYVAHFDGTSWSHVRIDSIGWWVAGGSVAAITGFSDASIFAAGCYYNSYNGIVTKRGVVIKWDGLRWRNISPNTTQLFFSVAAVSPTDLYACGDSGAVFHFDGNTWTELTAPTQLQIWGSSTLPNGQVYAVACDPWNSPRGSMVLRLDGQIARQETFIEGRRVFGLWGNNDGVYAVGEGVWYKQHDTSWQAITTPYHQVRLRGISGFKSNDVIICGAFGATLHWNGASWKFFDELFDQQSSKDYCAVAAIGGRYFIVGHSASRALVAVGQRVE